MLRRINVVPSHNRVADEPVTVGVGNGALDIEPPEEGATFENPPNGGYRAWLIVLSCFLINMLLSIMEMLIDLSILDEKMSNETGIDLGVQDDISYLFQALVYVYAPLGAVVMIRFGYRVTVCIGAGLVMVAVIILSFLKDTEHAIKFLLYGPTAIGMSFINLGALIPVLEYFTTKRMKALFLSRLGTYAGRITYGLMILLKSYDINWRDCLRGCTGLCSGIGLLGLTLQELKLNMKEGTGTFAARTLGVGSKQILKNALFWATCAIYFFYQWGIETPQGEIISMDERLEMNTNEIYVYQFSPIIGGLFGMFFAWIFKKVFYEEESRLHMRSLKADRIKIVFGILFVAAFSMSIGCYIAPRAVNFSYFLSFSILFAALFEFCEGLRDDAVPEEFGREYVQIVEGFILMFAGLGGVITYEIGADIHDDDYDNWDDYLADIHDDNDDNWKKLFDYGGGMLLLSSLVTLTVLVLIQSKTIPSKFQSNAVIPLNQTNEGSTSKKSRKTTVVNTTLQQQPGTSTNNNGGFQNNNTRSETVPNQVGGNGYQQPDTIIRNQANQNPQRKQATPVLYQHSSIKPIPQQAEVIGNSHMNAQPHQQASVILPNQTGSFMTYQSQDRTQQTDVPQNQPQSVVTIQDLQ